MRPSISWTHCKAGSSVAPIRRSPNGFPSCPVTPRCRWRASPSPNCIARSSPAASWPRSAASPCGAYPPSKIDPPVPRTFLRFMAPAYGALQTKFAASFVLPTPVRCINWILVHAALSYSCSTPPRRSRRIKVGLCESVGFSAADFPFAAFRRFWVDGLHALALAACTGLLTAHPHAPANRIDAPHTPS